MSIKTVKARKALLPANEPYWESLGHGKTIGYRVHKGGQGVWVAKLVSNKSRRVQTLSGLIHIPEADQYSAAVQLANEWFMSQGGPVGKVTVGMVCRGYAERKGNSIDDSRCRNLIDGDGIAGITLYALTERNIEEWKARHEQGKKTSTVNRQRTFLRAALNDALKRDLISSDRAWKRALKAGKPPKGEIVRRQLCYGREECRALVNACKGEFKDLCTVLLVMPLRAQVFSYALVQDYDAGFNSLYIRRDKEHAGRTVPVPAGLRGLFIEKQRNKRPEDLLFTTDAGKQWVVYEWRWLIKDAAMAAGLSDKTVMYTLRHSVITELCVSGMDLMTLAKVAGTSLEMLQKHYGHLRQDAAALVMDSIML